MTKARRIIWFTNNRNVQKAHPFKIFLKNPINTVVLLKMSLKEWFGIIQKLSSTYFVENLILLGDRVERHLLLVRSKLPQTGSNHFWDRISASEKHFFLSKAVFGRCHFSDFSHCSKAGKRLADTVQMLHYNNVNLNLWDLVPIIIIEINLLKVLHV